jgi:sugar porter (SP) family MFS transporter
MSASGEASPLVNGSREKHGKSSAALADERKEQPDKGSVDRPSWYLCGVVLFASFVAVLLGYDIGVMSGAILDIETTLGLSIIQKQLVVGSLNFVSAFGSLFAATFSDWVGRRMCIFVSMVMYTLGTALMTAANTFSVMLAGRFVCGLGVGCGMATVPVFIAEISPARMRGKMCACFEIAICTGLLLGYISCICFYKLPSNISWRVMIGIALAPATVVLCTVFCALPESPRWLIRQGREDEARGVLSRTCGAEEVEETMVSMKGLLHGHEMLNEEEQAQKSSLLKACCSPTPCSNASNELPPSAVASRKALLVGIAIATFQQANGSEAAVYYVPQLMDKAGMHRRVDQLWGQFAVGVFKAGFIFVGLLLLDRCGRRPVLLLSTALVTLCIVGLAVCFATNAPPVYTIITLCLYMASFSIGEGPIT